VLLRTPSTPDHRAALAGVDCVGGAWVVLDGLAAASIQNLENLEKPGEGGVNVDILDLFCPAPTIS